MYSLSFVLICIVLIKVLPVKKRTNLFLSFVSIRNSCIQKMQSMIDYVYCCDFYQRLKLFESNHENLVLNAYCKQEGLRGICPNEHMQSGTVDKCTCPNLDFQPNYIA